jgi:hypothetical protein
MLTFMAWDPEAFSERCNQAMCETNARAPRDFPWGLFAWADAPPAIGGGVGGFQWFKDLPELLAFVTDLSPAGYATFDDEAEWLELRDSLRRIAAGYEAHPEEAIRAFNEELTSLLQIDWIGPFGDLVADEGAFPVMVRARYRGDWDDSPEASSCAAIEESEQQSFLAFLSEYGA